MKKINKRQYISTLIVCFVAIAILSFCTIQAFYKKAVDDTLSVGESALKATERADGCIFVERNGCS